tara:strand:+ start:215 stop:445 length:231 start_codon:yes stop_codon:yes gene_type:complete
MSLKKKRNINKATVSANSSTDLHLILLWLKSNQAISSAGPIRKNKSKYSSSVSLKVEKEKAKNIAKDRFGTFVSLK